eukprot:1288048-Amphidinium_carterae.1
MASQRGCRSTFQNVLEHIRNAVPMVWFTEGKGSNPSKTLCPGPPQSWGKLAYDIGRSFQMKFAEERIERTGPAKL